MKTPKTELPEGVEPLGKAPTETEIPKEEASKEKLVAALFERGGVLVVGEYRGTRVEDKEGQDGDTGRKRSYQQATHSIESIDAHGGLVTMNVVQYSKDNSEYPVMPELLRGVMVCCRPSKVINDKGVLRVTVPLGQMIVVE